MKTKTKIKIKTKIKTKINIFSNYNAAKEAALQDYNIWKTTFEDNKAYSKITNSWAVIRSRDIDTKYFYPVCPVSENKHEEQEYNSNWFNKKEGF